MPRTNALLLIDSEDLGQWQSPSFQSHWRNETSQYGSLALMDSALVTTDPKNTSNITIEFDGSAMNIYGMSRKAWDLSSSLDGKAQAAYPVQSKSSWGKWYQTDSILPGSHKVELSNIPNDIYIDYVVAHPPFKYSINEETLLVDDTDPIIQYSGAGWQQSTEQFIVSLDTPFDTFGGTTHITRTVGDVLQFPFTGSTISVYGFAIMNAAGNVSVSFQIDDSAPIVKKLPPQKDDVGSSDTVIPNYLYLDRNLKAGDHILTINVTEVHGDQRFILDYILYETSFDSLDTMPVITLPSLPNSSPPKGPQFPATAASSASKTSRIIGGVIGGIVGLFIITASIIYFVLRRRKRRRTEKLIALPAPFLDLESTPARIAIEKQQGRNTEEPSPVMPSLHAITSQEAESSSNGQSPASSPDRQRVIELERQVNELLAERQPPPSYSDIQLPRRVRPSQENPSVPKD